VAPRTGKIIKNGKRRKFATKWYISFCVYAKPIARNRQSPLSKTRQPFLIILPIRGATGAANDVGIMSDIPDNGS